MHQRKVRFPLPVKATDCLDHEGRQIKAFTLRTTNGHDEAYANKRASATGQSYYLELMAVALLTYERQVGDVVETVEVTQPNTSLMEWSSKARGYVLAGWRRLTIPDDEDLVDFLAGGSEVV